MLFNSLAFAIFFPAVTILYFLLAHRWRWSMLLAASCFFYCFFIPAYILILFFTIAVDYCAGILIEGSTGPRRRLWLLASLAANIGALAVFKYAPFVESNVNALAAALGWNYSLSLLAFILPIGLSFHTFQAMAYTIEVYRGNQPAERHLGIFALYVMFYPQLVAGPIERPQHLLHQFREQHRFDGDRVASGLKQMAWGLFKKVVIADRIAPIVDVAYADPASFSGPQLTVATVLYAFQIYCDFSGYSDIALGAAKVMGFRLMVNFRQPYFSRSINEFWHRWHISLSSWFRDYLYISLGGNRVPAWRWQMNLLIVFLVSGLWHGANWTFVIWGALHGFYLVFSLWSAAARARLAAASGLIRHPRLHQGLKLAVTFSLVCFAWIFFRAENIDTALTLISRLPQGWNEVSMAVFGVPPEDWAILLTALGVLGTADVLLESGGLRRFALAPAYVRWAAYYALTFAIIAYGRFGAQQFIYFQF